MIPNDLNLSIFCAFGPAHFTLVHQRLVSALHLQGIETRRWKRHFHPEIAQTWQAGRCVKTRLWILDGDTSSPLVAPTSNGLDFPLVWIDGVR